MTKTYRRAVFVGPGKIRFDELPIPEPGPRQALVRVRTCALCTWEQRMYSGEERHYPMAGGHEVAGELVRVGKWLHTDAEIGDPVVVSTLTRCGYCESCRRGLDNLCDNNRKPFKDTDVPGPGGLAEYVLADDYQLYTAGGVTQFETICLAEPLACVVRSVRKAGVGHSDSVAIIGAGIMGLLHLILAKRAGARVIVSEIDRQRAAVAREIGADDVVGAAPGSFVEQVGVFTGGRGADVIFCATSAASVVEQAVEAAAKGGRVHVYASIHPHGTRISINPNLFHRREIVLTGTMSQNKEEVLQAVQMIVRGDVDLRPFVSLKLPLERLEEALQAASRMDTYRVVVTM